MTLNVLRLPTVWKHQGVFSAEVCDKMREELDLQHERFVAQVHPSTRATSLAFRVAMQYKMCVRVRGNPKG